MQTHDETKRSTQQRNFMPFGGGIRLCLGAEFGKLFISLFLHVLVTKYRYNIHEQICTNRSHIHASHSCAVLMVSVGGKR
jgi:cytochrome P450